VSSVGNIRSLNRYVTYRGNSFRFLLGQAISQYPCTSGYPQVVLSKNGKQKTIRTHVIVARAFIGERPTGLDICHNDGDKTNSAANNLRYDSRKANLDDRHLQGTMRSAITANVFNEVDIPPIRRRARSGEGVCSIARSLGVNHATISNIVNRKTWKHVA
jgi:hypothetical protein